MYFGHQQKFINRRKRNCVYHPESGRLRPFFFVHRPALPNPDDTPAIVLLARQFALSVYGFPFSTVVLQDNWKEHLKPLQLKLLTKEVKPEGFPVFSKPEILLIH